jgi:hypothetical protein
LAAEPALDGAHGRALALDDGQHMAKVWHNIVLRAGIAALSEFNPLDVKPFLA